MNLARRAGCAFAAVFSLPAVAGDYLPPVDAAREAARAASAAQEAEVVIEAVDVEGERRWTLGDAAPLTLRPGERVVLHGRGFGGGVDVDYSKIMLGATRVLERDLHMYRGDVRLLQRHFYQIPYAFDSWQSGILDWRDDRVSFSVPETALAGPLVVSVQKRTGSNPAFENRARPFTLLDPLTSRIEGRFPHLSDVVSTVGAPRTSEAVPTSVVNPAAASLLSLGEAIYWSYDYNIGLTHFASGLDWRRIFSGNAVDPVTGRRADPYELFGAIPVDAGQVPEVARRGFYFNPYPMPNPVKPPLGRQPTAGRAMPSGWVGYVTGESVHPINHRRGEWIGFNCASCHARLIKYEATPGKQVARVFPGIPNVNWSMKWNVLGDMKGVRIREPGPDGRVSLVDKTQILYAIPHGAGEHSLVRDAGDGSPYANDHLFSPIAIPIITRHTPVRRALSQTDMIAGFEGSYIHSEEPDGGLGAMAAGPLKALTAYMATLDADHATLVDLGLYRHLRDEGNLALVGDASEGEFMAARHTSYPALTARIDSGRSTFVRDCESCHARNFDTWTDESMRPLDEVGSYFSPTIFNLRTRAIRTAILRDLYWVEGRGLLHDGHVPSLATLVSPARCDEGSALYQRLYTLNETTFKVRKGNPAEERALRLHAYFTDVPWDAEHLYWDYQAMRRNFGPRELGLRQAVPLPAAPHPWCAGSEEEVSDLVLYLLTL